MKSRMRSLVYIVVILALVLVAAACGPAEEATPTPTPPPVATPTPTPIGAPTATPTPVGAPKRGGVWQGWLNRDPPHFETWGLALPGPNNEATNGLVRFDPTKVRAGPDTMIPDLAESWDISADGKTYTFHLRKGVKFHDGVPFTSEDAAFTLDVIRTPTDGQEALGKKYGGTGAVLTVAPYAAWYKWIDTLETPDDLTLVVKLKQPQPSFLVLLCVQQAASIMPKHTALSKPLALQREVNGTGAYRFVSYSPGENWVMERNPDYWNQPLPYVDKFVMNIILDPGTGLAAFRTGQLHYFTTQDVDGAEVIRREKPNVQFFKRMRLGYGNFFFNTDMPPFNDPRVWRAMSLVMDREKLEATVSRGTGVWKAAAMPPGYWALPDEELDKFPEFGWPYEKRVELAKQLMAEAGYPNGFKTVAITWPVPYMTNIAIFAREALKNIGIDQEIRQIERSAFYELVFARDFEMSTWTFGTKLNDPDSILYEFYYCGSDRNYSRYCHREISDMIDEQSRITDPEKRRELVWEIQKRIWEEPFIVQLGWDGRVHMLQPEVRGFVPFDPHTSYIQSRYDTVWFER